MKVSLNWLKELVDLKVPIEKLVETLNLKTIGVKEVTDKYIELDMKGYNRADLLSLRGVAYEIAAITKSEIKFKETTPADYYWVGKNLSQTTVEIEDPSLASIQCVVKIEGLKVDKSTDDWIEKLESSGMRPVNNIVDATNLIMLEYGQPLHAFDEATIQYDTINVRRAKPNEAITTLDRKLRKLEKEDIVLSDTKKALDVAGVMGGIDTEIKDKTHTILLSVSLFNPTMVRKTGTRLGLSSEASKRFYHGLSKKRLFQALDAAIKLYISLGGKVTSFVFKGNFNEDSPKIPVSLNKIRSLTGVQFSKSEVEELLKKLNFEIRSSDGSWVVTPPYYRLDVSIEEDVIEEVARMYGYEKIQPEPLPGEPPAPSDQSLFELLDKIRTSLVEIGLTEVQTYSFYSTAVLEALGFNEQTKSSLIKIANPISSETEYMRMNIWPNLVEAISKNQKLGLKDIAIFEIGKVYIKNNQFKEQHRLSIALSDTSDNPLKKLHTFSKKLGFKLEESDKKPEGSFRDLFHPNRFLTIKSETEFKGGEAEVHLRVLDKLGVKGRVAVLEINLENL